MVAGTWRTAPVGKGQDHGCGVDARGKADDVGLQGENHRFACGDPPRTRRNREPLVGIGKTRHHSEVKSRAVQCSWEMVSDCPAGFAPPAAALKRNEAGLMVAPVV